MKNLHIKIAAYMSIFLMVGCSSQEDLAIQVAKAEVAKQLKDPESAKFYDVAVVYQGSKVDYPVSMSVCGSVNGKNAFGAYSGAVRFVVKMISHKKNEPSAYLAMLDNSKDPEIFNQVFWNRSCIKETNQVKK